MIPMKPSKPCPTPGTQYPGMFDCAGLCGSVIWKSSPNQICVACRMRRAEGRKKLAADRRAAKTAP